MDSSITHLFGKKNNKQNLQMHHFTVLIIYPVALRIMVPLEFHVFPESGNGQLLATITFPTLH